MASEILSNPLVYKLALQFFAVKKTLSNYGKRMMGWDEIFQPGLPKDAVIHSWQGKEALAEAAKQGYQAVLSNGYYIDLSHPTEGHYLNDPLPAGHDLDEEAAARILGGRRPCGANW